MKTSRLIFNSLLKQVIVFLAVFTSPIVLGNSTSQVTDFFKARVSTINQTLLVEQGRFEQHPEQLASFVDQHLLPLWQSSKTLKGLFGKKHWLSFSEGAKSSLKQGFNNTLQRYVQEGFSHYDGQRLEFVGVKFNKKQTRGRLTVKIIPNLVPSFNVDLKIYKERDSWFLYDVMVKGVSYISIKKDSFRKMLQEQGIETVIASIRTKNQGFIASKISEVTTSSNARLQAANK